MKNTANTKSKLFRSTWMLALALVMMTAAGCGKKKSDNHIATPPPPIDGWTGNACNQINGCYGMPNYGNMFVTALGRIDSPSSLQAELALNFSATNTYNSMNSYAGNTTVVGTLNVYSSTGICPIPAGQQYQMTGSLVTFNSGMSFVGQITSNSGPVQVVIEFVNSFLGQGPVSSIMGPSFMYKAQNDIRVHVQTPYGLQSCGPYVMY